MQTHNKINLIVVAVLILAGAAFFAWRTSSNDETQIPEQALVGAALNVEALSIPANPPEDYVKYENKKYGFSYYHSPQSVITEYDEGGGAITIVQENLQKMRGLQIFIVPYTEETISEERFRLDAPSGVRRNVENAYIGSPQVRAVTFNGYDESLGETREIWFIYKGHLYEITTFKGVGDWLTPIMQTWRFI